MCICKEGSPRAHFTLLKPPRRTARVHHLVFHSRNGSPGHWVGPAKGREGRVMCVRPPPKQNLTRRKGNFKQIQCQGSERSTVAWSKTCIYIYIVKHFKTYYMIIHDTNHVELRTLFDIFVCPSKDGFGNVVPCAAVQLGLSCHKLSHPPARTISTSQWL